ncbi:hypothetical protein BVC80_9013g48 [Macleaya cordata]|uniref:F-box domain-containing protein n=1 Tax=Macleaya cordata TaxID=56857 RepID=A0A200QQ95_MACCD|nr:hypothetical protein BVC80_9013g48 [Macleaya cordata]
MDTILLHSPSLSKRPCCVDPSLEISRVPNSNHMDRLLEKFLGFPESSTSIDLTLERLLESRACDSDQNEMIENALRMGSILLEAGKRSQRKRFTKHNSIAWALPPDLTIKVFSMLDTQSLCFAAASCSMFNKCAMDPMCYANIDLTSVVPKVNNTVVCTMIQRAGKNLQSLKLGILPSPTTLPGTSRLVYGIKSSVDAGFSWNDKRSRQGKESYVLTRSCLMSLSTDGGASGALLKRLHLYNIEKMETSALCAALSVCQALLDLEVVGLHVELKQTLESVSTNCHYIERLFIESSKTGRDDSLKSPTCVDFVNGCPHLTTLALRGFKLQDYKVRVLVKGFRKLKVVDFSTSYSITGTFLRNLGSGTNGHLLEVLILRDCMHLKEVEVGRVLSAVLAGDFRFLKYLDISNREGLASDHDWYDRCYSPRYTFPFGIDALHLVFSLPIISLCKFCSTLPIKRVMEERPEICLLADFPPEGSFMEIEQILESEVNSDASLPLQISSPTSDSSLFMSSSESSYNSDQGSGNEDGHDGGLVLYEESSDELDFLSA